MLNSEDISSEQKISYQVSYSIRDSQTREREVRALVRLNNYIPQNQMFIITKDEEETIEIRGNTVTMQIRPYEIKTLRIHPAQKT